MRTSDCDNPVRAAASGANLRQPEELGYRLHQQSMLSEFGRRALEAPTLDFLLTHAVRLCAEGMRARFCKALEHLGDRDLFLVRAGVGWKPGVVGRATLDADLRSPAGLAFRTGEPVLSNALPTDSRFRMPPLLSEHGVKRLLNVPIPLSEGRNWGVLAADSPDEGTFDAADGEFMEGMARLLGVSIQGLLAKQQWEEHAALLRLSQDAVIVWTASRGIELWSQGAARLYGFTSGEALGRLPAELIKPVYPSPSASVAKALETRGGWEGEVRQRRKDGGEVVVLSRLQQVTGPEGNDRLLEVNRDITPRKRVEEALRASEERFRTLYEAQHTAHLVLSRDLIIEDVSPAYLEATMTRRQDLIGKHMFEAFPANPDDPSATGVRNLRSSLARALQTHEPDRMPVQKYDIRRPSGEFEVRWWAPLNLPVFADDGTVRHIIHQVEDVTAEMIERQRVAEARAGEARFRAVAEAIPGLVFESDAAGRYTYVNHHYRDHTGLPFEALLGDGWHQVVHPDDRERVDAAWSEASRTGDSYEVECRLRGRDGTWRWFMRRASALRGGDGRVEKWIGVCTDIDDARRAQEALRDSEEQFRSLADPLPQLAWMARGRLRQSVGLRVLG
jgi:PAS domain S-box-containing protein